MFLFGKDGCSVFSPDLYAILKVNMKMLEFNKSQPFKDSIFKA